MTASEDPVIALLGLLDMKLDRLLATLDEHTIRLLEIERWLWERDTPRHEDVQAELDRVRARFERRLTDTSACDRLARS